MHHWLLAAGPVSIDGQHGNGAPPSLDPSLFLRAFHIDLVSPLVIVLAFFAAVGFVTWLYVQLRSEQGTVSGGGLNYVVGPMGSGKSMFGVRAIVRALRAGQYVVTNVALLEGWDEAICRKLFPRDRSPERRAARIEWLREHYVLERSLRQAMRYRVPCGVCGGDPKVCGHSGPEQEGRAVFVWDETHNDLNNRDYQGHGLDRDARELERERRRLVLRWATQLRKLGFVGFLLSQHQENTDAQLRRVCNHVIRLQNQRSRGIGVLLPKRLTMFLVYWYPAHLADGTTRVESVRKERYLLPWMRHLYDSWEVYHGLDDELDEDNAPILLGSVGRRGPALAGNPAPAPRLTLPAPSAPSSTLSSVTLSRETAPATAPLSESLDLRTQADVVTG